MPEQNHYQVLGIAQKADQDEIKRAYRHLARRYHPDVSQLPDCEAKFKAVSQAYDVLKDEQRRQRYDHSILQAKNRSDFRSSQVHRYNRSSPPGGQSNNAGRFQDFFSDVLGDKRGRANPINLTSTLKVSLADAINGAEQQILVKVDEQDRSINVKIPKGVRQGQTIRLAGQGRSHGRTTGDLLLKIEYETSPLFSVQGDEVLMYLPITPWEAALGCEITIPLPSGGKAQLKVPEDSVSGRRLRLRGKGLPNRQSKDPDGDLIVELEIALPPADTPARVKAFEDFAQAVNYHPRRGMGFD